MNFVGISVEPSSFNIIVKQRTLSILIERELKRLGTFDFENAFSNVQWVIQREKKLERIDFKLTDVTAHNLSITDVCKVLGADSVPNLLLCNLRPLKMSVKRANT